MQCCSLAIIPQAGGEARNLQFIDVADKSGDFLLYYFSLRRLKFLDASQGMKGLII
jgi:hypothetical protein